MLAEIYLNSPLFLKTVIVFGTFIAPVACVAVWCFLPPRKNNR